jgi:hypothetical protein
MAAWQKMEKALMGGLLGSGMLIHLSLPTSVPTIPVGSFLEILEEQKCSITMVNMQYARVSTRQGGLLLPFANYHVMLGHSADESVYLTQRMAAKICAEEELDMKFEQSSLLDEALANGRSLASGMWLGVNQFIVGKYAFLM